MIRTSVRLPPDVIHRLDALARALGARQVGKVTRADVLRTILEEGLARVERQVLRGSRRRKAGKGSLGGR